ncbi:MAG: ABC transporter permease [Planctomycetota bacterium]|nr:ABC transporter permease [Planctomycetota bacterium]
MALRLSFFVRFAWQDLRERHALPTTLVNACTIMVVVAFGCIAYGLTFGVQANRLAQLEADPDVRRIEVGDDSREGSVSEQQLDILKLKLSENIPPPHQPAQCFPFRRVWLSWHGYSSLSGTDGDELRGRTIQVGDPLLDSLGLRLGGSRIEDNEEKGLILSPRMLLRLGVPSESTFEELCKKKLDYRTRTKPFKVTPLGVTEKEIFSGYYFIISEGGEHWLRNADPNPPLEWINTGRLPQNWPDFSLELDRQAADSTAAKPAEDATAQERSHYPAEIRRLFGKNGAWHIAVPETCESLPDEDGKTYSYWRLTSKIKDIAPQDPWPDLEVWRSQLDRIGQLMHAPEAGFDYAGPKQDPFVVDVNSPNIGKARYPRRTDYEKVTIYVGEVEDLEPAALACEQAGFKPDRENIDKLVRIGGDTTKAFQAMSVVLAVVAFIGVWNMWVSQALRAHQKIAEIGMLKAMGMKRGELSCLYVVEAAMLWIGGCGAGFLVGVPGGIALSHRVAIWMYGERIAADTSCFHLPGSVVWCLIGGSALVCLASMWLATRKARNAAPSASLQAMY